MKKPEISIIHELGTIKRGHEKGLPMGPDSIGLRDCDPIPRIGETVKAWGESSSGGKTEYPVVKDVEYGYFENNTITVIVGRR